MDVLDICHQLFEVHGIMYTFLKQSIQAELIHIPLKQFHHYSAATDHFLIGLQYVICNQNKERVNFQRSNDHLDFSGFARIR